jgi:preprotein translocase subunit YajC
MFNSSDLLFIVAMVVVMYFLIFLPKRREQQAMNKMLAELKKGDKVLTHAGMIGEVAGIKDNVVTLRFHDGVRIDFSKTAIQKLMGDEKQQASDVKKVVEAKA